MQLQKESKGVISLILLAFGFGMMAITPRYLSLYFTLLQQIYLSLGVAFIVSLFIFPRTLTFKKLKGAPINDWRIIFFRVVAGYLFGVSLYREALVLTKIANVAFIQSIPFAALFGWILFKEKFTWTKLILLLIAYLGVVIISIKDYSFIFIMGKGEIFAFISSALFALSYVSRKWQTDFLNDKEIAQILLFLGTILILLISLMNGERLLSIRWEWILLLALFVTGFFNAVNIFLINYGFRNVKAVLAANILTLEAVFAVILAFIFYKELPNIKELVGGILILGSVIQMNRLKE